MDSSHGTRQEDDVCMANPGFSSLISQVVRWWQLMITVRSLGEKSVYLPKGFLERTTLSENWTLKHDQGEHKGCGGQKSPAGQLLIGKIP